MFAAGGKDVRFELTRQEVETAVAPIIERCRGPIRIALEEASLSPKEIFHVVLVGGPTIMPAVRRMVMEEFQTNAQVLQELRAIDDHGFPVHPMEAVAQGAVLLRVSSFHSSSRADSLATAVTKSVAAPTVMTTIPCSRWKKSHSEKNRQSNKS